jgi:hypothetical protein
MSTIGPALIPPWQVIFGTGGADGLGLGLGLGSGLGLDVGLGEGLSSGLGVGVACVVAVTDGEGEALEAVGGAPQAHAYTIKHTIVATLPMLEG